MKVAVIFDMDGVIVDNGKYHILAFRELCSRYNVTFSEDEFKNRFFGRINEEILPQLLKRDLSEREIDELANEKEALYREIYLPELTAMPGLKHFILELSQKGIPIGVATSAPKENVEFVLQGLGIDSLIDVIVDDTMVIRGKPDPEIYLKAASLLKTKPQNCVVFEDSLSGTKAAFDAGAKVIAVTTTLPAEDHRYSHLCISDFTKIGIHDLVQLIHKTL